MKLDWKNTSMGVEADLPAIPGYTDETGEATVLIQQYEPQGPDDYGYDSPEPVYYFTFFIPYKGEMLQYSWRHFGVPEMGEWDDVTDREWTGSVEDMMSAVEWLDPEDIADNLKDHGYLPDEN